MKKLFYFAFMAMLCCGFTACGDDDDNGGEGNVKDLYGRWTLVKEIWTSNEGREIDVYEPGETVIFFDEDGTGYEREGSWTDPFVYMISGNQLTFYYVNYEDYMHVTISSLSASKLVVISEEFDEYGYSRGELHLSRY